MSFREEFERTLASAETGDAEAQRTAGLALLRGSVVPRDVDAGRALLERAIEQGDSDALHALAQHDLLAGKLGRGAHSAWELLRAGAERGDDRARLQVARGIAHGLTINGENEANAYFKRTGLPAQRALAIELASAVSPANAKQAREVLDSLRDDSAHDSTA